MAVRRLELPAIPAGVFEVLERCQAEERPGEPLRTRAEAEAFILNPPASDLREHWAAEDDGTVVGFAQLAGVRGSQALRVEVLVRPDARRRGHGTALLETVLGRARQRDARILIGVHATEAGSRFAAQAGAVDDQREVRSLLRLPIETAVAPVRGYELASWVGAAPEALLESFARAREAINDAPFPTGDEPERWDGSRVRALEAALERRERDIRVTVALDGPDEVVAFTELRVSRETGATATTEDSAVVAAHRRRGIGRWVKVESLQRLQADRPDVTAVTTVNAEENEAILAINRWLGFVPVSVQTTCVLELPG